MIFLYQKAPIFMMAVAVANFKFLKMKQVLLVFVKNAVKGKVKTRLAATVGDDVAFEIYNRLLLHTALSTNPVSAHKIVFYSDFIDAKDIWNNELYQKQIQNGNDLGERMANAFEYAFKNGSEKVDIIGSDCFEITTEFIEGAFKQLDHSDVVIGPALDGGYYLLALKSNNKALFQHIQWSTDQVLSQTMEVCRQMGLKVAQLQLLSDIDNESDLKRIGYNYQI